MCNIYLNILLLLLLSFQVDALCQKERGTERNKYVDRVLITSQRARARARCGFVYSGECCKSRMTSTVATLRRERTREKEKEREQVGRRGKETSIGPLILTQEGKRERENIFSSFQMERPSIDCYLNNFLNNFSIYSRCNRIMKEKKKIFIYTSFVRLIEIIQFLFLSIFFLSMKTIVISISGKKIYHSVLHGEKRI